MITTSNTFPAQEGTFYVYETTAWSQNLRVTADGQGVVALAGAVGLRMLADRTGLTGSLSQVLTRRGFHPVHDRGRMLTDAATAIGCGARDIVDVEALRARSLAPGRPPAGRHHISTNLLDQIDREAKRCTV